MMLDHLRLPSEHDEPTPLRSLITQRDQIATIFNDTAGKLGVVFKAYKLDDDILATFDYYASKDTIAFAMNETGYNAQNKAFKKAFVFENGQAYLRPDKILYKSLAMGGIFKSLKQLAETRTTANQGILKFVLDAQGLTPDDDLSNAQTELYYKNGDYYIDASKLADTKSASWFEPTDTRN